VARQAERARVTANLTGERSWRVVEGLRWRCWDGDFVVFNPLSGYTHLLDVVTGQTLSLLISGHSTVAAVRSGVSAFLEVPDDDKLAKAVDDILIRLEDTGLVERLD
jgi:PqqD family protein of HPr-rel-A system